MINFYVEAITTVPNLPVASWVCFGIALFLLGVSIGGNKK